MKKSGPQESDFTARGLPWQVVIPDGVGPGDEFEADARVRGGPHADIDYTDTVRHGHAPCVHSCTGTR